MLSEKMKRAGIGFCLAILLAMAWGPTGTVAADETALKQGIELFKKLQYKNAETELIKSLASGTLPVKDSVTANIVLGRIHLIMAPKRIDSHWDLEKARGYFDEAVELNPDYKWSFYWRGNVLNMLGRLPEAAEDADRMLEIDRSHFGFALRAAVYENMEEYEPAIKDMDEALKLSPGNSEYYLTRARLNRLTGNFEEAFSGLKKAWQEGYPEAGYHLERGKTLFVMGHFNRAFGEFTRTVRVYGTQSSSELEFILAKAWYYISKQAYERAENDLFTVIDKAFMVKAWAPARENLALVRWLYLKQDKPFDNSHLTNWVAQMDPDSWTMKMIDFLEGKLDEKAVLEFPDRIPNETDRQRLKRLTQYLAAQKRIQDGDENGGITLLQSLAASSQNRMIGAIAEIQIRQMKNRPQRMAGMLPVAIEAELPLVADYKDTKREKVWEWAIEPMYLDFLQFFHGRNLFRGNLVSPKKKSGRYCLINSKNQVLYDDLKRPIGVDELGLFQVFMDGYCEYHNDKDELVATTRLKPYTDFHEDGRRSAKIDGQWCLVDMKDRVVAKGEYWPMGEGMYRKKEGALLALADGSGKKITEAKYEKTDRFSEGAVWVAEKGVLGYFIDKTGKRLFETPNEFSTSRFHNGFARVYLKEGGKKGWALLDKKGNLLGNQLFKECGPMDSGGLARVTTLKGKRGFMDKEGKWINDPPALPHPLKWEDISYYEVSLSFAGKDSLQGLMDSRGNVVLPAQFPFVKGMWDEDTILPREAKLLSETPLMPVSPDLKIWGYIRLKTME